MASIGILTIHLRLPGCSSLKEKRSRLKPLFSKLRKEFNISIAEIDNQDIWQNSIIAIAFVSNNRTYTHKVLTKVPAWINTHWYDVDLIDDYIELI